MCSCCDKQIKEYEHKYRAYHPETGWEFPCYGCAKRYPWTYLENATSDSVLINSDWPIYWDGA